MLQYIQAVKKSKLYIEGLALVEGHFSGIGQYILGVIRGIDEIAEIRSNQGDPLPPVTVIIPYDSVARFNEFNFKHIRYKTVPIPFRIMSALWSRGWMPPLDLYCGKGTYIFTRFVSTPLIFSRSAIVIFDLSYELHAEFSDDKNARFLSKGVKRSLRKSSKVITISQNAKKEILDFYSLQSSQVAVATPAVDNAMFYRRSPEEISEVKHKYKIEGNYILALSNLEPRKNISGLVEAYCNLPKALRDKFSLLLVGVNGWKTEALFDLILQKVGQGYSILRPSEYVTDKDKPAIISGASLLVYPSHYEGFGMPPLEALACGVPVITSDNSSLPEVVKGVGTMVKSTDTTELTNVMTEALNHSSELKAQMTQLGPRQAAKFSWTKSGQVFLDVAKELDQ